MQFPATLVQLAENPPPMALEGKISETGSIHFMQFPATLVQLAEKPPTPTPNTSFNIGLIYMTEIRTRTSTRKERLLAGYVNLLVLLLKTTTNPPRNNSSVSLSVQFIYSFCCCQVLILFFSVVFQNLNEKYVSFLTKWEVLGNRQVN